MALSTSLIEIESFLVTLETISKSSVVSSSDLSVPRLSFTLFITRIPVSSFLLDSLFHFFSVFRLEQDSDNVGRKVIRRRCLKRQNSLRIGMKFSIQPRNNLLIRVELPSFSPRRIRPITQRRCQPVRRQTETLRFRWATSSFSRSPRP